MSFSTVTSDPLAHGVVLRWGGCLNDGRQEGSHARYEEKGDYTGGARGTDYWKDKNKGARV